MRKGSDRKAEGRRQKAETRDRFRRLLFVVLPSAFCLLPFLARCATSAARIESVPEAPRYRSLTLAADGKVAASSIPLAVTSGPIRVEGNRIVNGAKALTDAFAAVDSFDVSQSRGEVVFSAKRDKDFDIGLVSTDGSPVNWVPNDPADEIAVQWAPRGNKVSYVVRGAGGDVLRTVHVPTSYQLSVALPAYARVHALAWDAAAEKFAVSWSAPDTSDRVEVMRYGGEERRTAVEPAARLDVEVEPFAPGVLLLRPRDLAYDERLPLVVWREELADWNDARATLMRKARVAVAIATKDPDAAFWKAAGDTPWIDSARVFVVGAKSEQGTSIIGVPSVPAGRYRISGSVVSVAPAVVQSFAAGFIADQLKRTTPTNGRSR